MADDSLAGPAAELVQHWLSAGEAALTRRERRDRRRFQLLSGDERSLGFTMAFCDRVLRPENDRVAAVQLASVAKGPAPAFLSMSDRLLLACGARLAVVAPSLVMPLTRRRLRQIVGGLVVDRNERTLRRQLRRLRRDGFAVNVNLLGESVLGDEEAARRVLAISELIARPDIDYVSVKASAVASQLNLWGYDETLERVKTALRRLYEAANSAANDAANSAAPTFVNLDMEEYRDLRLTVDAFRALLEEPELVGVAAGIVVQAYLPDSFDVLCELVGWAGARYSAGGGTVKIRIVKGANLAMEAVDAAMHGWQPAPYASKAETDANYKRMVDWALSVDHPAGVRIGIASHNLFDLAWAHLLAAERGVTDRVEMEMLQGMAPGLARAVQKTTGQVRLYTPVVAEADFDSALAYLFRRLEENSSGENFLRRMYDLRTDPAVFTAEQTRFEAALNDRWRVSSQSRRTAAPPVPGSTSFSNAPDSDPTNVVFRKRVAAAVAHYRPADVPAEITGTSGIDRVVTLAGHTHSAWQAYSPVARAALLRRVAVELALRRPELLAVMAHEASKPVVEGDSEVSEAIDLAAYYAGEIPGARGSRDVDASFTPLGVIVVTPPWNFPLAIPVGGVVAALAAGNTVILKAPPQTPQCALQVADVVWAACRAEGLPSEILQYVTCPEAVVGEHLISHPGVGGVVLTGSRETARQFAVLAPGKPLFAETSGKNAMVIMPDADLDLAAADLVASAFGHAGQKCSAASLAICVGDVYASARFRRQLVDAARSLVLGPATDLAVTMPPLIGPPGPDLKRALTTLDPGEEWLLAPALVDSDRQLWSPGIKVGVAPGSWFHQTECFGPVLGLLGARDLEEALRLQNATAFGLTGGIHSLDPDVIQRWEQDVEVGNAYVNRAITGAVVQRQPFGGWKGSSVGPGAKAGGPNYVAQLGSWADAGLPQEGEVPFPLIAELVASLDEFIAPQRRLWLQAAVRSDQWWQRHHFSQSRDDANLFCEGNVLRYRPFPRLALRAETDTEMANFVRVFAAVISAGCDFDLSVPPGPLGELDSMLGTRETSAEFVARMKAAPPDRIRVLGTLGPELRSSELPCFADARPPVANGGIEGLRYRREQVVSKTLHRFGNLTRT